MKLRILDRFILKSFIRLFVIFVTGAPLLFILGDATENLDRYLDRGIPLGDVLLSYVYQYPQFVFWAFPIAALLATVFTIHPMTTHREVMAAKAGGISFHRLVLPIILMGFLLTGVGLVLAEVAPRATQISSELRGDRERRTAWRNNFVYVTDGGAILTVRRLTVADGRITAPTLQRLAPDPESSAQHILAQEGRWREGEGWAFQNGYSREIHPDGRETTFRFEEILIRDIEEQPGDLLEGFRDEDEMTYAELGQLGDRLLRSGGAVGRTFTKMEQRLAIPVASLVIILFGAPLATSSKRGGAAFGIGVSLATTIFYLMLFRFSGALGYAGTVDPRVAAWLPNFVFLVAGLILMKRVRT